MKKVLSIFLIAVFFLCSCEDTNKEHIKNAYNYLCDASVELEKLSDTIQTAWHYGIYSTTNDSTTNIKGLESKTGISAGSLIAGHLSALIDGEIVDADFSTPAECVYACIYAMSYYDAIHAICLAEEEIKNIDSNHKDYDSIKKFYSDARTFYDWLKDPDGNYNQATDTINDYNNKLKSHKNDLKLDYGD